jgi:hypothetical protein
VGGVTRGKSDKEQLKREEWKGTAEGGVKRNSWGRSEKELPKEEK